MILDVSHMQPSHDQCTSIQPPNLIVSIVTPIKLMLGTTSVQSCTSDITHTLPLTSNELRLWRLACF